jgi:hypothetical protein
VQADTLTRAARILIVGAGLVFLLAVVAAGTHAGFGNNGGHGTVSRTLVSYGVTTFIVLIVVLLPVAIYFRLMELKESPPESPHSLRRVLRGLMGIAAAMVFAYMLHLVWPHIHPQHGAPKTKQPPQLGKGGLKLGHAAKPAGPTFEWPVLIAAAVFLLVAFGIAVYRIRTRPPLAPLEGLGLEEDLAATIGDAIDDLESEPDARRAVIAAYARMEAVLGRHGLQRRLSETPIEYLRRVLSGITAHGDAVSRLTSLFERAKFSSHSIEDDAKQQAIASLREIREGIA